MAASFPDGTACSRISRPWAAPTVAKSALCCLLRGLLGLGAADIGHELSLIRIERGIRGLQQRRDVARANACGFLALAGGDQQALELPRGIDSPQIVRSACREKVGPYLLISVFHVTLKKKKKK